MATLTATQRAHLRRLLAADVPNVTWTKAQADAMHQAIEDAFEAFRPTLNAAINAATAPFTMPVPAKQAGAKNWLLEKYEAGG